MLFSLQVLPLRSCIDMQHIRPEPVRRVQHGIGKAVNLTDGCHCVTSVESTAGPFFSGLDRSGGHCRPRSMNTCRVAHVAMSNLPAKVFDLLELKADRCAAQQRVSS